MDRCRMSDPNWKNRTLWTGRDNLLSGGRQRVGPSGNARPRRVDRFHVQRDAGTQTLSSRLSGASTVRRVDWHSASELAGEGTNRIPHTEADRAVAAHSARQQYQGRRGAWPPAVARRTVSGSPGERAVGV